MGVKMQTSIRDSRIREIAQSAGITGVEAQHILNALYEKNIDPSVIDWEHVISQVRDYGNRYEAVWKYLGENYGITKPWQYEYTSQKIQQYNLREIEYNAEQFKEWLSQQPFYQEVMNAICLGSGNIPKDIQDAIGYAGKKFEIFKTYLCEDFSYSLPEEYSPSDKMIEKGIAKLREHYKRITPDDYRKCGSLGGIRTAVCLKELSHRVASADSWVTSWEQSMRG